MLKIVRYSVYALLLTLPSLSAYAFVPAFKFSHGYVIEYSVLFLFFLTLCTALVFVVLRFNGIREENIPVMSNKMCDIAYNQRVYNCNAYAGSFEILARKKPEEIWETYSEVWQKRPQLFNEQTALVMRGLEEQFG